MQQNIGIYLKKYPAILNSGLDNNKQKEDMKIGCCLAYYKNHNNYGTSLQGYATVKVLQKLGHDVRIIKYQKKDSWMRLLRIIPLQLISGGYKAYIRKTKKRLKANVSDDYAKNIRIRTKTNNEFKNKTMESMCDVYVGYNALRQGAYRYDAVLVGSDQVWTPLGLYSRFFNLLFVDDNIRKISYASSFGVSKIPWFQRKATGNYLDRINYLSVREIKAKDIVESLSHNKAQVVCDPTMLCTKEEWMEELSGRTSLINDEYLFCYLLGKNIQTRKKITKFAENKGLKIVTLRHVDEFIECDESFGDICFYDVNPIDFINLINNATCVCTDSFHGSVFSILFNKKFVTFYRFSNESSNSRNSRIDSLFTLLGLQKRLYSGELEKQMDAYIDYDSVNTKIAEIRQESFNFLNKALG